MRSPAEIGYLFPQQDTGETSWSKVWAICGRVLVRGGWICFHDQCFSTCARFSRDSTRYLPFVFRIAPVYLPRMETDQFLYISRVLRRVVKKLIRWNTRAHRLLSTNALFERVSTRARFSRYILISDRSRGIFISRVLRRVYKEVNTLKYASITDTLFVREDGQLSDQ